MDLKNQTQKRIIKFRIFNKKIKSYININTSAIFIDELNNLNDNLIVEQFTGLHDKNGKEIYEGDIVNWGMHHSNSEERFHRYAIVEFNPDIQFKIIFYINSQNGVKKETDGHIFRFGQFAYKETEKHLQVLGNIYENSELL